MSRFFFLRLAACAVAFSSFLVTGCSDKTLGHETDGVVAGKVFGGQQPITGATIQLYAVGATGTGSAATALISSTVLSSDGSGSAGNTLPAGYFTITGKYTCPTAQSQVYLTAVGGNPGLTAGTNNTAISQMVALGSCGLLSSGTTLVVDEVTTVAAVAALYPYMTSYSAIGAASTNAGGMALSFQTANLYGNSVNGLAPGLSLPTNYYASTTEIYTLADVLANCVNSAGGSAPGGVSDGTSCGNLFAAAYPGTGTVPTDTVGAALSILQNPTNNVNGIFSLVASSVPFQPTLATAPASWALPIMHLPVAPAFSPVAGSYVGTQSVTISSSTSGAVIYYTTDGSTPSTSSTKYTGPVSVSATQTVKAVVVSGGQSGPVGSAAYTVLAMPGTPTFAVTAGSYSAPQSVAISSTTANAVVYYTTDGSTPSAASTVYLAPLSVTKSETVKAIAIANSVSSGVGSAAYTIAPASGSVYVYAGGGAGGPADGTVATSSALTQPYGVAFDSKGNLYEADFSQGIVLRIDVGTGLIRKVAGSGGTGTYDVSQEGVQATLVPLNGPASLAIDGSDNLYIAEVSNNRVRKVVLSTGVITTFAGNGGTTYSSAQEGASATSATLNGPQGVAVDAAGNVYIADTLNSRVRKVDAGTGLITTFAGNGGTTYSSSQENAAATSGVVLRPGGVAVDLAGDVFVSSTTGFRIFRIAAGTGLMTTLIGTGSTGTACANGVAPTSCFLGAVYGLAVDAVGDVFYADSTRFAVREFVASKGTMTTVAGTGTSGFTDNVSATTGQVKTVRGITIDAAGNLYVADSTNTRVRKVVVGGLITTVAGGGSVSRGDGQAATNALIGGVVQSALDSSGNLYIADSTYGVVRKVAAGSGIISTVAGTGTSGNWSSSYEGGQATAAVLGSISGVAVDGSGNLYIGDVSRVVKVVLSTGVITTVVGGGSTTGTAASGLQGTAMSLSYAENLSVDSSGNVYVADTNAYLIWQWNATTGVMKLIAGNGTNTYGGDGLQATATGVNAPFGVVADTAGNVYFTDYNSAVRQVVLSTGVVTTLASITSPQGLGVDASNNVYVAFFSNNAIQKVTVGSTPVTSTVASITSPYGVVVAPSGVMYVSSAAKVYVVYP